MILISRGLRAGSFSRHVAAFVMLSGTLVTASVAAAQPPPPQPRGLALDPLTPVERRTAERVARADPRVRDLVGEGGRLSYVEFVAVKAEDEREAPARHAEVVFLRADAQFGVRALVSLQREPAVVAVDKIPEADVPMTAADLEMARKLALENAEVRAAGEARLAKATVEGLRIVATDDDDPCFRSRCVRLLFKIGRDYLSQPVVVVNLTKSSVTVERTR